MLHTRLFFSNELSGEEKKFTDAVYEKVVAEKESGEIGYFELPYHSTELEKIEDFVKSNPIITSGALKNLFVIGIGGSSLGTKAIDSALLKSPHRKAVNLVFLDNCDPVALERELGKASLENSLAIMISKSGSTIETTSNAKVLMEKFKLLESQEIANHFCTVTDKGSPLDRLSDELGIKAFYNPKNVGGRFSVLSPVGLLPLAILGYNIKEILEGARSIGDSFFSKNCDDIIKKAFFYAEGAKERNINVLFSYYSDMSYMNAWYTQLWAESLGKLNRRGERVGLTPVGLVGSIDQHSFLQLIIEGPRDKTVTFIKVRDFENAMKIPNISLKNIEKTDYVNGLKCQDLINAQCDSTLEVLDELGIPVDLIEVDRIDEKNIGAIIYYYELLTSLTGAFFGINTYIQDGVELGKVKLLEKLK